MKIVYYGLLKKGDPADKKFSFEFESGRIPERGEKFDMRYIDGNAEWTGLYRVTKVEHFIKKKGRRVKESYTISFEPDDLLPQEKPRP